MIKITIEADDAADLRASLQALLGGVVDNAAMVTGVPQPKPDPRFATNGINPERAQLGHDLLVPIVGLWWDGFDLDGRAHWDDDGEAERADTAQALRDLGKHRNGGATVAYVRSVGGLTHAMRAILKELHPEVDTVSTGHARRIAENLTQVASLLYPPLSDELEHHDPYGD